MRRSRLVAPIVEFLRTEAAGGVALLAAAAVALLWANTGWAGTYRDLWEHRLAVGGGALGHTADLRHWINDGLMAVFFFVVGMEIKRELVRGELRDRRAAALPVIAALGGMAGAALVYLAVAGTSAPRGWAVPMATDIALVLGVLALLGPRAPAPLKLFLLALAIADDIATIAVLALAYSTGLHPLWLAGAALSLLAVVVLNRLETAHPWVFVAPALAAWWCTLHSGVPATVSGVALGLLVPADPVRGRPLLERLEHRLHPISSFIVIPVFALANLGVGLGAAALTRTFGSAVGWGILTARLVGKPVGVIAATLVAVRSGVSALPRGMTRAGLVAAGLLTGLGFTVPIFVADLAFADRHRLEAATIGLVVGSVVAGTAGAIVVARVRSAAMPTVALVDDLMDRSRISGALPAVTFVRTPADCAGADVVLVDLARHVGSVAAVRAAAPEARIVCFGPHVDETAAAAAREAGADEVLARSRFFHDPGSAVRG